MGNEWCFAAINQSDPKYLFKRVRGQKIMVGGEKMSAFSQLLLFKKKKKKKWQKLVLFLEKQGDSHNKCTNVAG